MSVILHSYHEYYKHGFNFLGDDKSSGQRLDLLKGMLHGTGADGLLPSRKATWSVLLSAAPPRLPSCVSLLALLAGCNTCSGASEKLELKVFPLGTGLVLRAVLIHCAVAPVMPCSLPRLSRCLADQHQWLPFGFAGWKSNQKPQEKQK